MFAEIMNSVSSPAMQARALSLPNVLTYGRIAAVPLVVACMYWQAILQGGLWLRWLALAIFIAAAITDFFDGYLARAWGQQSRARPHARSDRRQASGRVCLLMLAADERSRAGRCGPPSSSCAARSWSRACANISPSCASACRSRNSPNGRPPLQLVAIGFLLGGEAVDFRVRRHRLILRGAGDRTVSPADDDRAGRSPLTSGIVLLWDFQRLIDAIYRLGLFPRRLAAYHDLKRQCRREVPAPSARRPGSNEAAQKFLQGLCSVE